MATGHTQKAREKEFTEEQKARIEAIRATHRTPEARADERRVRDILDREYRETGTIKPTGDPTTMGDAITFLRFIMSLRRERERLGLSLSDVAERAGIDKGALSRLENGQQLNPTVNTLTRYVRALGKSMAWILDGNRNCPECGRAGGIIDGLRDQWGFCQSCEVKWRILGNPIARLAHETDQDRPGHEEALTGYREVVLNPPRSDQPGE